MSNGDSSGEQLSIEGNAVKLGIVCPMANERATAVEFVKSVLAQCVGFASVKFFAVLDNACTDGTVDVLRQVQDDICELEVVWAPDNTCVVDGYVRGYEVALGSGCDWILEIDAGFSHQPGEIPQFFEKMIQGYDCVFGSRFCEGGKFTEAPVSRYLISRAGGIVSNVLLGTGLKDMTSGFELFGRGALEQVLAKGIASRGHFFQTEIKFHCRNMKSVEVPIHYRAPSHNVSAGIILDSLRNLFRLFVKRVTGR
jgi:dolichol-phosphate mannosyltransferase